MYGCAAWGANSENVSSVSNSVHISSVLTCNPAPELYARVDGAGGILGLDVSQQ